MRPTITIVEQPMSNRQRFRYKCEGNSAGSLIGVNSTQLVKTFPSIRVSDHRGPAAVVISCVSRDSPHHPHPHNLVGQDCENGVCTLKVKNCNNIIPMTNVGIQCCKRQDIMACLKKREDMRVDPFGNIRDVHKEKVDLSVVRLCFQVFIPNEQNKFVVALDPVVSDPIMDKKSVQELVVCRTSISRGSCLGGDEMILLCEKINKDDIQVRFYEETQDGVSWEDYGEFKPSEVHRQCAIILKTPAYKDKNIGNPVDVHLQLLKPSNSSCGEPVSFQYIPQSGGLTADCSESVINEFLSNINDCGSTALTLNQGLPGLISEDQLWNIISSSSNQNPGFPQTLNFAEIFELSSNNQPNNEFSNTITGNQVVILKRSNETGDWKQLKRQRHL